MVINVNMKNFNDGNNFLMVKEDSIVIWGLDVKPLEVRKTEVIKRCITENEIFIDEVCEIVEYDVIELYKLCIKLYSICAMKR